MDEKQKLIWLLFAIQNTIATRLNPSQELTDAVLGLLQLASAELDPQLTIPQPRIQLLVSDFRLPKDVLDRAA